MNTYLPDNACLRQAELARLHGIRASQDFYRDLEATVALRLHLGKSSTSRRKRAMIKECEAYIKSPPEEGHDLTKTSTGTCQATLAPGSPSTAPGLARDPHQHLLTWLDRPDIQAGTMIPGLYHYIAIAEDQEAHF